MDNFACGLDADQFTSVDVNQENRVFKFLDAWDETVKPGHNSRGIKKKKKSPRYLINFNVNDYFEIQKDSMGSYANCRKKPCKTNK